MIGWVCYLILTSLAEAEALVIYKSNLSLSTELGVAGLHYLKRKDQDVTLTHSLTACIRINFKRLNRDGRARIFAIDNPASEEDLLTLRAQYPSTWIAFGNQERGEGYFSSWILKDPLTASYQIWSTNQWHHVCVAYAKASSRFTVVKNGNVSNLDRIDNHVQHVFLPDNLLDLIYIGRCVNKKDSCSQHAGDITDVNLWNRALSLQEMIDWTSCQ